MWSAAAVTVSGFMATHAVQKISWRGTYPRLLRLNEELQTIDPSNHRVTNSFPFSDVLNCRMTGSELLIEVAQANLCGLLKRELRLSLGTVVRAAAVSADVRAHMVRRPTDEDSERARAVSAEASVVSAAPRDQLSGDLGPSGANAGGASDPFTFDVCVCIQKARSLPVPPTLCGGPIVDCAWGVPEARVEHGRRGSSAAATALADMAQIPPQRGPRHGSEFVTGVAVGAGAASTQPPGLSGGGAQSAEAGGAWPSGGGDDVLSLEEGLGAPVEFATQPGDGDACNPRWDYELCFRYRATGAELTSRRFVLTFFHRSWPFGQRVLFGTCDVSLNGIATGPTRYDLPVKAASGDIAGRVVFSVSMVQQCGLTITIPRANVTMRATTKHTSQASQEAAHREASFSLSASLTMGEAECPPTRAEFDSTRAPPQTLIMLRQPPSPKVAYIDRQPLLALRADTSRARLSSG